MTIEHRAQSNEDINSLVHDIASNTCITQFSLSGSAHMRRELYKLIFLYTAKARDPYIKEINDLKRKLYIAEKAVEDVQEADPENRRRLRTL